VEILLDPKSSSGVVHPLHLPAAAAVASAATAASSFLPNFSLLAVPTDRIISSLISPITSSSCSSVGPIHAVSSAAKIFCTWADHCDLPCLLHQFPTSPVGCACPALFTLLSRASICSYRSAKQMLSASSSSSSANSQVAVFSVSWLKILSHSSECSSFSSTSSVVSFSATASSAS
jgi:hypothetical protein